MSRWLWALGLMLGAASVVGAGFTELAPQGTGRAGFTRIAPEQSGVGFTNWLSPGRSITNQVLFNGSGVALGDADGDGWVDLYFCGLDGPNRLYRNLGDWRFADITTAAGVGCDDMDGTGAAFADVDGDGDLDLLVDGLGQGTRLLLNDGKGQFRDVTVAAGLASKAAATSLALADIDGDGDLDLYVTHYRPSVLRDSPRTKFRIKLVHGLPEVTLVNDQPVTTPDLMGRYSLNSNGALVEHGELDGFYRNDGRGGFQRVPWTEEGLFLDAAGQPIELPYDWGLSVMFRDVNGDLAPDLYVCNDFDSEDRLWLNDGKGRFRLVPTLALRHTPYFTMSVDFADVDRDGHVDFLVADMLSPVHGTRVTRMHETMQEPYAVGDVESRPQYMRNQLQRNRGDTTFAEIGFFSGIEATDWTWTPVFLDVDLDGYEDLLISNGYGRDDVDMDIGERLTRAKAARQLTVREELELRRASPPIEPPKMAYHNQGDLTFRECGRDWGFDATSISQGMALADLDNDGDLDLVLNTMNGAALLYRNDTAAPRLAVRLKGLAPNTQGIGAQITVRGGPVAQSQEVIAGGRYLSADDPMRVFAAWHPTHTFQIEVAWRSARRSVLDGARANRIYVLDEAEAVSAPAPASAPTAPAPPWFEDASARLGHAHRDKPFDDYARQPLLPKQFSTLGPGVAWADVNGDGHDDLLIGSGRGGALGVYLNDGQGGFAAANEAGFEQPVTRDQAGLAVLPAAAGVRLLVGSANYEDGLAEGASVRAFDFVTKQASDLIPAATATPGPLVLADVDGDGDLDLFVGGRLLPGRYPEPAPSRWFRNQAGKFELDAVLGEPFTEVGLVSGAVASDLDGDGWLDLALACEWGPVRVFHNSHRGFTEITQALGLADFTGWWNGIAAGDLDGDGRLDLVVSNWGLNSKYRATPAHPRMLYYGDLDANGTVDLIEAFYDEAQNKIVPERMLKPILAALPFLQERVTTHRDYATSSVQQLLGDRFASARSASATTLASMVFLNRGDRFEAVPLPAEAQFSAAFGVNVADLDGDGWEDVVLAQNFFATATGTSRLDAGVGLWLRGGKQARLTPVSRQQSGIAVYGEQRGCALADYDEDGRVDVVLTQVGNPTKLYRNAQAKPGLRVRLRGRAENPTAVGAAMRLVTAHGEGPVREIHAGSGYWSQDSPVQVLSGPGPAQRVWVRWPGGQTTLAEVPAGARDLVVTQ